MGKFCRRSLMEGHVRPALVVVPSPGFDNNFYFLQVFEPMQVQAFVPEGSIKGFNMAIVGWLAGPAEIDTRLMMTRPQVQQGD